MRIGLLQCDHVVDRFRAISGDYNDMFVTLLGDFNGTLTIYDVKNGQLPDGPSACDGYVISGSSASAFDDELWIRDLEEFVRHATNAAVPVFGVCFGLQVMATALGGTVERSEFGWGVGVHTSLVYSGREWMVPEKSSVALIMSHRDQVIEIPRGAQVLGSSEHCRNYLVEFTSNCIGIQGHPEFTPAYAKALYTDRRERLGPLTDPAVESLDSPSDRLLVAQWIHEFFTYALSSRAGRHSG